jgi:DNA-binding response OmpR family regulator
MWRNNSNGGTEAHACRLRAKLGVDGDRYILNVWGVGYRLVDDPGSSVSALEVAA